MQYLLLPAGNPSLNLSAQDVTVFEGPEVELHTEVDNQTGIIPAKRQKLDHLSPFEKLSRRKLKNRVAAQVARDKKKARLEELENIARNLQRENERLTAENARLQNENAVLSSGKAVTGGSCNCSLRKEVFPVESAALINGPLPQEQGNILFLVVAVLLHLMSHSQAKVLEGQSNGLFLQKPKLPFPPASQISLDVMSKKQPP